MDPGWFGLRLVPCRFLVFRILCFTASIICRCIWLYLRGLCRVSGFVLTTWMHVYEWNILIQFHIFKYVEWEIRLGNTYIFSNAVTLRRSNLLLIWKLFFQFNLIIKIKKCELSSIVFWEHFLFFDSSDVNDART